MKEKTMRQKILFFISAPNPTEADLAAAEKIGTTAFRYAGAIRPIDTLEKCDAVAGDPDVIPESYKAAFTVVTGDATDKKTVVDARRVTRP